MLVRIKSGELERLRKRAGFSRHELSLKSGLGKNAISNMEKGESKSSLVRIKAVADVLSIDYHKLVDEEKKDDRGNDGSRKNEF